jgi:DnaJ-class molecular chaperone
MQVTTRLYEDLGLKDFATAEEIKKAYKSCALKYHPDRQGGDEAKMKQVNHAYEVLSKYKSQYDEQLRIRKYGQAPRRQEVKVVFTNYYYTSSGGTSSGGWYGTW